jgi:hypothetical protein
MTNQNPSLDEIVRILNDVPMYNEKGEDPRSHREVLSMDDRTYIYWRRGILHLLDAHPWG